MSQTDRQTDKTTRWAFTAYEDQWGLFKDIPDIVKEWGWQTEICPDTKRPHYQGYILTRTQQRFSAMKKALPGVHIEPARNWNALINYCKKPETAVEGTQVTQTNDRKYLKFADALVRIANAYVVCPMEDLSPVDYQEKMFKKAVEQLCLLNPDDISLYSNPQIFRAWKMCQGLWLRMALHSHADGCMNADVCDLCSQSEAMCDGCKVVESSAEDIFSRYSIVCDEGI